MVQVTLDSNVRATQFYSEKHRGGIWLDAAGITVHLAGDNMAAVAEARRLARELSAAAAALEHTMNAVTLVESAIA